MKPVKLRIVREIPSHEMKRKVDGEWTAYGLSDGRWFFPNYHEIFKGIKSFGKYPVDITLFPEDNGDLIDELKEFGGDSYVHDENLEILLVENQVPFKLEDVNKDTYCVVNDGVVVYQGTDKKQFIAEIFFFKVQSSLKNFTDKQQFMAEIKQAVAEIDG